MIDLSHLTDEEQERIMAVLNRDSVLKRHEEERVSNLQKSLDQGKNLDTKVLKYLTGEWFYEAKSRRHNDRIHGSEIILASMKQMETGNIGLTPSMSEASVNSSSISSPRASPSIVPPPKPARLRPDSPLVQEKSVLNAEADQPKSALRSPGRPRHNPFNRGSLIVVEPNEKTEEPITTGDQGHQRSSDTEAMAPLKNPITDPPTSGGSVTSEGSSSGPRPVPKKRTFASRRRSTSAQSVPGCNLSEDGKIIVPAPRLSPQQRSQSVAAKQSRERSVESKALKETETLVSQHSPRAARPPKHPTQKDEPAGDVVNVPSVTPEISIASTKLDGPTDNRRVSDLKRNQHEDSLTTNPSTSKMKAPESGKPSSAPFRDEELSVTQSIVGKPVRYDLIEKPLQPAAPSSCPKPILTHQISTASEGEEGSIAKVLDWFSRSTDSNEWLDTEDSQQAVMNMDRKEDMEVKESEQSSETDFHHKHPPAQSGQYKDSRRISKEKTSTREEKTSTREEKTSTKLHSNAGKENRSAKSRKDSFGNISSRTSAMRRATSMFSLNVDEEQDHGIKSQEGVRRPSANYRHYLGMTEDTGVNALAPVVREQSGYDCDWSGPGRASPTLGTEERYGRRGRKASQPPLWVNHSSSDTGRESSLSSPSESRSNSRTSSNWENDSEDTNPVKRALRRAEVKPKTMTKSLEDITASVSPRQERRPDPIDLRRSSNATSISTASTASFSDPDHMKEMRKSVPAFLQKEKLREFHIFVVQCQGLAAVDPKRGRSDPYVKSYLVPDKEGLGKRKTAVKKKTLHPEFNEILKYRVRMEYLRTQTLILSMWHHDTFGKNSFLGEVDVDLSTWDFDHTRMNYLALRARVPFAMAPWDNRGEIRLAIRFLPQVTPSEVVSKDVPAMGEVHIWVKDCKSLPLIRPSIDPYVKCFVLPDTSRKSRQKTRVLRGTTNPIFNHTMVYDGIKQMDLVEACVELTVWDQDRLASNLLGGLRLGLGTGRSYGTAVNWMDSSLDEIALWERMMTSPSEWVEALLPLRMLTSAKTASK
ncbi:hypothetical protein NHX12_009429 [Muraenolepis orangiensis]|uniref:Synaptotagmin-like protein 2 n=1 Tax=Muraenolepis orangiensis TaxID=630683 RepID=A0A9Q0DQR7_9TELE|nr:hypothetical protein NHX12_009429 [Muraenolepis orangiensis]